MISVVCSSQYPLDEFKKHILTTSGLGKHIEFLGYENKGEFSLTEIYNRGLKEAKYNTIVFVHHDVIIETAGWGRKIIDHFKAEEDFGILGVAGTTDMPATGMWWADRTKMTGIVNHKIGDKPKYESKYSISSGNKVNEVLIVDGVFFAVDKSRIKNGFNEDIKGFHFYDIDFAFSNSLRGVGVGVITNVRITHKSIGETNEEWEKNRQQFVEIYKDKLPKNIIPDFIKVEQSIKDTPKTKIKIIIQSSGDRELFERLYLDIIKTGYLISDVYLITNDTSYDLFKDIDYPNVKVFEGFYNSLPKNLSILKHEDDFITDKDELIFFMNDNIRILNNIFYNISQIYINNKRIFGGAFPMSYNENKTIFSNRFEIYANDKNQASINLKDTGTYYNVNYGYVESALGNFADCFVTTPSLLKMLDWFQINYETPIYFNDFGLKTYLKGYRIYNDTSSLTVQKSFINQQQIQADVQSLINFIGTEERLKPLIKLIK